MKNMVITRLFFILFSSIQYKADALEIKPDRLELGKINQDSVTIEQEIIIFNNEKTQLQIKKLRSSCDCIEIGLEHAVKLKPGQKFSIKIELIPSKLEKGKFRKYIFLEVIGSIKPVYVIEINGSIL